jgi:hypothetical protein
MIIDEIISVTNWTTVVCDEMTKLTKVTRCTRSMIYYVRGDVVGCTESVSVKLQIQ